MARRRAVGIIEKVERVHKRMKCRGRASLLRAEAESGCCCPAKGLEGIRPGLAGNPVRPPRVSMLDEDRAGEPKEWFGCTMEGSHMGECGQLVVPSKS
jgi:hypothetical protein